jgi:hypothetical protein
MQTMPIIQPIQVVPSPVAEAAHRLAVEAAASPAEAEVASANLKSCSVNATAFLIRHKEW